MMASFVEHVFKHLTNNFDQCIWEEEEVHGVGEQIARQGDGYSSLDLIACENLPVQYQCAGLILVMAAKITRLTSVLVASK